MNVRKHSESHISVNVLYDHFKSWFRSCNPKSPIPCIKEFRSGMGKYKQIKYVRIFDNIVRGFSNLQISE